jgi:sugar transferase (PEP-CTERM/EpsH1 system associated)
MASSSPELLAEPAASPGSPGLRVLYFATRACWPPDTGASLRNYYLIRELARAARVTYLAFAEPRLDGTTAGEGEAPAEQTCEQVVTVPRASPCTLPRLVRGALGATPLPVLNYTTEAMKRTLLRLLAEQEFDVIQIESLHLLGYLSILQAARPRPRLLWDWHNVESEVMGRYSERINSRPRRLYARLTARRMAKLERRAISAFDAHSVVSERDREQLLAMDPAARVFVIENGVDVAQYSSAACRRARAEAPTADGSPELLPGRPRILFVGSMDYHANIDAVITFAREVWPRLRREHADLIFTIVGRRPALEVRALARLDGIEVTGTVDDVRPYYVGAAAAVVPLQVGGGSRLKILEAMAAGVPVISTRLGAEGLPVRDGEHLLLAGTPDDFCRALAHVLRNEAVRQRIVLQAEAFVRERYDWAAIGGALRDVHQRLTACPDPAAAAGG